MAINRHLLHVKSNQTVTTTVDNESVTRAKLPSPTNIEHGEIAINYHDGYETISIKNDNNEIVEFPNLNVVNTLINDGDKIKSLTTYEASTPLAVGDTHDQALSKLSKIIDDNETVVARALTELEDTKADKDDLYTKDEVDNLIEETNDSLTQIIEDNELTIATALNDLDSRISNMKGSIEELNEPSESTPLAVGDTYDDAFAKLTKIIRDDEEITARALTDLNETKQDEITDLDTIRSGAARGATALQSETQLSKGTSTGDGNVVTDIAVNNHQITLTMGLTALTENALKTVNSLSLVGNGNIDAEDVILGKLVEGSGALPVKNFYRFNGTYTQKPTDIVPSPDFSDTAETPNDKKIYVDILTQKIYWYTSNSGMPAGQRFKELCEVDLSSYADGAEYDSTEKKIYLKHGATRLSNPIDATDFIKDGMVNSVRIDTLDDGSSDDGSDGYEAKYLIITFNTDAGMEDIEIPLSDIFDPSLYYTKEEIDEHELVTAAALTELHDTKQDLLSFDSTPTANSTNPVTSGGIKEYVDAGDKIKSLTTYEASTPLAVGDTHDQAFAKLTKIIRDNELATAGALTDLHDTKQDLLTFDNEPTENSENPVTSDGIYTALDGKQDALTFDSTPTANSTNPVTSGGVYAALSNINTDHLTEITYSELKTLRDDDELVPGMFYCITDYQCTTTQDETQSAGHQFDIVLLALSENKVAEEGWAMHHANDTYFANSNLSAWKVWYCLDNDAERFVWADTTNGKGVIYRLIDEFNNDIKYDFKNIQFKRTITNGQYDENNGTETWCYTLNVWYNNMCQDASIVGNTLPNNEGYITGVYDNNFGYTTAYDFYLGTNAFAFALGDNVVLSINDGGYYGISSNTIGNNFSYNTFGDGFQGNTIGNNFSYNTFGDGFQGNTIGNDVYYNVIGNHFQDNTIGNGVAHIIIGTKVNNTTTTKDYVRYLRIEDGVQYVDITTTATTSSSAYLQNITISQGIAGTSSSRKTITHPTVGDTFKTTYQSANSQVVSV